MSDGRQASRPIEADATPTGRPVLFIAHDASRTGAPMLLLHLLRWVRANTSMQFEILLRQAGELQPEFELLAPVTLLSREWRTGWRPADLLARVRQRRSVAYLRREWAVVYSNTITNGDVLELLGGGRSHTICHVHELEPTIHLHGRANIEAVKRHTARYIACSDAVRANLAERHGIDPATIEVIHEFIPARGEVANVTADRQRVREELGIPGSSLIVGASGTTDWRKSPDLFIQLARIVGRRRPDLPVDFVWVGGEGPRSQRFEQLRYDISGVGMSGRIHFLGERSDAQRYFAAFDVFALVSREDPYPLVCLEAAALGMPIVCFDGAGGEPEFVEDDCGFVVPYLDLDAMADRVLRLLESAPLRHQFGARAAEKVRSRHDVSVVAPQIVRAITQVR